MMSLFGFLPWYVWVLGVGAIVAVSVLGLWPIVIQILRRIPWWFYVGAAILGGLVLIHLWLIDENNKGWEKKIEGEQAVYKEKIAKLEAKQAEVVIKTITVYRDRVKVVKEKGDEIIKHVEVLVTGECNLTGGMRVLHDSAARGHLPDDPAGAASSAAPVDAPTLATTFAKNYAACRAEFVKLESLQKLVTSLQGVTP